MQTAALTGSGLLSIGSVGGGPALTATIVGIDVFSLGRTGGYNGLDSVINLSNIHYSGTNIALSQFRDEAQAEGGSLAISYQFGASKSLTALAAAGASTKTTYSGTLTTVESDNLTAVPEPGTFGLALSGSLLLGLGYYRQYRHARF